MLVFDKVTKFYRTKGVKKTILSEFSFEFPSDRNVGIMGKNGAGKSTMMRLMAGIEPPDRGHVYRTTRVSWPLGFAGGFNGSMTGIENIRFVSRIYGQETEKVIDYVTEFAELGPSLRLPIKTYSSGMKARLAFGLSMAIDFDVYLIDEITAVGDEDFKKKSQAVFQDKLAKSQIIMISHSAGTIKQYCDCGLLLEGNQIRYFDDVDDLLAAYKKLNSR
ncbi:ABC transporter ATP-binding protein [Thalassobacter stenotrophicus]|jgi:capsular polysaccharide transport system ATP-binding protein|uniref:ABC transporter ATP-binding protein n=1 Tax=Thalassobacter stenotrophicus TaxID=266809 RepID=UPI00051FEC8F|nr:ABC transporter ATP-binding protein [Thalassobacter stenotrophicus]KGK78072.1 ABC transporter ATP-binding protein [Thalassobacter stenotrophicus]